MAPRFNYTTKQMSDAIKAVRDGMSKKRAAKLFNVPKSTLLGKLRSRTPEKRRMGRNPYLTESKENCIVRWIKEQIRRGFPPSRAAIINSAQMIIKKYKLVTPFKDNRPRENWLKLFFKRHPDIPKPPKDSASFARSCATEEALKKWFISVDNEMRSLNVLDAFDDPSRIYSINETNLQLCPNSGRVLGVRNWQNVNRIVEGSDKSNITFIDCFNARGDCICPGIIYPYMKTPGDILSSVPENWFIGKSKNGWMKPDIFFEYLTTGFIPWIYANAIKLPVILFIDGNKRHSSAEAMQLCAENSILLYFLPPNSSHVLQPVIVGAFQSFKEVWRDEVSEFRRNNPDTVIKRSFVAPLFASILNRVEKSSVIDGFCATGLCPFNPCMPDYSKCVPSFAKQEIDLDAVDGFINPEHQKIAVEVVRKILGEETIRKIENKEEVDSRILHHFWSVLNETETEYSINSLPSTSTNNGNIIVKQEDITVENFVSSSNKNDYSYFVKQVSPKKSDMKVPTKSGRKSTPSRKRKADPSEVVYQIKNTQGKLVIKSFGNIKIETDAEQFC